MAPWLKLDTNILNDEKIEVIRKMPDGDTLFTLWIGLLCLAMKKETDSLYIASDVPYNHESLSTVLKIPLDTVRLGLGLFVKLEMIELLDDGAVLISHLQDHQSLDGLSRKRDLTAARMRRYRARIADDRDVVTRNGVTLPSTVTLTEEEGEEEVREDKTCAAAVAAVPVLKPEPYREDFEAVWKLYPRKRNRKGAYKAYVTRRRSGIEAGELERATIGYARHVKLEGTEERYVLHGATFYGPNERWREWMETKQEVKAEAKVRLCPACGGRVLSGISSCSGCGLDVVSFGDAAAIREAKEVYSRRKG